MDLLLAEAEKATTTKELFDVICRSSIVLIVAHFEGFIKDSARAIIDDLNRFSNFKDSPAVVKKTFCYQFANSDDGHRIKKLIETFEGLETKLKVEPFLFDENKNPAPTVIEKIAKNFGVNSFFRHIHESRLDAVFNGTKSDTEALYKELVEEVLSGTQEFPYKLDPSKFGIVHGKPATNVRSFWETFLDQLLEKRHAIAHGSSVENRLSVEEILDFKSKILILQRSFILILCHTIASKMKDKNNPPPKSEPPPTQPA